MGIIDSMKDGDSYYTPEKRFTREEIDRAKMSASASERFDLERRTEPVRVDEWGILTDMTRPELGEHAWDEPRQFITDVVRQLQEKRQFLLGLKREEGTYEKDEGILQDLENDLENYITAEKLKKVDSQLAKNLRLKSRLEGVSVGTISEQAIEQAKDFPIKEIVGVPVKNTGRYLTCTCPLHQENTPSFIIYPENTWYCFGCNQGGDSIDLVMAMDTISFAQAVKELN